jgi:hypothetical protein
MYAKLSMVIASHLSDAQHDFEAGNDKHGHYRLNFIKSLVLQNQSLDKEVNEEYLWKVWKECEIWNPKD